jgi:hypothetical protein
MAPDSLSHLGRPTAGAEQCGLVGRDRIQVCDRVASATLVLFITQFGERACIRECGFIKKNDETQKRGFYIPEPNWSLVSDSGINLGSWNM